MKYPYDTHNSTLIHITYASMVSAKLDACTKNQECIVYHCRCKSPSNMDEKTGSNSLPEPPVSTEASDISMSTELRVICFV